jgi:hypothetical protein
VQEDIGILLSNVNTELHATTHHVTGIDDIMEAFLSTPSSVSSPNHNFPKAYLDEFAKTIQSNVDQVLERVASSTTTNKSQQTQQQQQQDGSHRSPKGLKERYQQLFEKERQRFRRQQKQKRPKQSVSEMWDQALLSTGRLFPIHSETSRPNDDDHSVRQNNSFKISRHDEDNQFIQQRQRHLSPIFELPLNTQSEIDNLDEFLQTLQKETLDDTTDLEEETDDDSFSMMINEASFLPPLPDNPNEIYHDAITRSISLLRVMKPDEWRRFELEIYNEEEEAGAVIDHDEFARIDDSVVKENELRLNVDDVEENDGGFNARLDKFMVDDFLHEAARNRYPLSTLEANLLLSHLVTLVNVDSDTIIRACMQLYDEMKLLSESGRHHCQPDSTTYRILVLALNGRLAAPSEAIKLSHEMIENSFAELSPEVFLEVMKACHAKMDLTTARKLVGLALENHEIRPPVSSFILFAEMMKIHDLRDEALSFFDQLQKVRIHH